MLHITLLEWCVIERCSEFTYWDLFAFVVGYKQFMIPFFPAAMTYGNSGEDGLDDSLCKGSEVETVLSISSVTTHTDG